MIPRFDVSITNWSSPEGKFCRYTDHESEQNRLVGLIEKANDLFSAIENVESLMKQWEDVKDWRAEVKKTGIEL